MVASYNLHCFPPTQTVDLRRDNSQLKTSVQGFFHALPYARTDTNSLNHLTIESNRAEFPCSACLAIGLFSAIRSKEYNKINHRRAYFVLTISHFRGIRRGTRHIRWRDDLRGEPGREQPILSPQHIIIAVNRSIRIRPSSPGVGQRSRAGRLQFITG